MDARAVTVSVMQGEQIYRPSVLHHQGTQWECRELQRMNAHRSASRICFSLPNSAYFQRVCGKYGGCDLQVRRYRRE